MPKFNQRKDYSYTKPKFNNNLGKKHWTHINVKGFQDINDSSPSHKWLYAKCLTHSQSCYSDILRQIEDITRTPLKAYNIFYSNGMLEFYIKVKKTDADYIIRNSQRIEHYRVKFYKNEDVHVPSEMPSNWIDVIKQVLERRYITNSINNEAELNLSSFSEDKLLADNNLILNFSTPRVFECVLNILVKELKELTKLNLSNNNLTTLHKLKSFISSVNILRLDISSNRITNINEISFLENSSIIDLNITGNQFRKFTAQELKKEVRKILPNLQYLNGMKLEEGVVIAGDTLSSFKSLPEIIKSPKEGDAVNFVLNFFSKFDSKSRDELCDFYSSDSVLTMATYGESLPYYKSNSSNYFYKDSERRKESIKRGKAQILGAYVNFPPTKHLEETINIDIVDSNNTFMILVISGVFIELPVNSNGIYRIREFSRNMIIVQGGIILQEFIQLFPNDNNLYQKNKPAIELIKEQVEFAKSHKELENLSTQEIEIVRQFKKFSRMNISTCLRFLKLFSGLEAASEEFKKLQAQGSIPSEAFQD